MSRLVDLFELIERDESVERETPLTIEFDKPRNEDIGNTVALDDPANGPAEEKGIDVKTDFRADGGRADDTAGSTGVETVDRLAQDRLCLESGGNSLATFSEHRDLGLIRPRGQG